MTNQDVVQFLLNDKQQLMKDVAPLKSIDTLLTTPVNNLLLSYVAQHSPIVADLHEHILTHYTNEKWSMQLTSQYLRIHREAGLVEVTKEGKYRRYKITEKLKQIIQLLKEESNDEKSNA